MAPSPQGLGIFSTSLCHETPPSHFIKDTAFFFHSTQTSLFISHFIPLCFFFFSLLSISWLLKLSLAEAGWKHSHSDHILHPHPLFLFLSLSSFSHSHIIADLSRVLTLSWWTFSLPPPPTKHPYFPFIPFPPCLSFSPSLSASVFF